MKKTRLILFLLCLLCTAGCDKDEKPDELPLASGTTGSLWWTLDKENTLTISGVGDMLDYFRPPWPVDLISTVIINGSVTSIGTNAFYGCKVLKSVTIPNSVTSIGGNAFYGCYALKSATIPNSLTSIGFLAFAGCGLTSVIIPNSVTSIGERAFWGSNALMAVTIPNSVKSIGDWAFSGCIALTSVTIPYSVTSLGDYAFSYCHGLKEVFNESGTPQEIAADTFYNVDLLAITLRVPVTSVEYYRATPVWKNFGNIVAIE